MRSLRYAYSISAMDAAHVGAIDGSVMAPQSIMWVATEQISAGQVWHVRRMLDLETVELAALNGTDRGAAAIELMRPKLAPDLAKGRATCRHSRCRDPAL